METKTIKITTAKNMIDVLKYLEHRKEIQTIEDKIFSFIAALLISFASLYSIASMASF